MLEKGEKRRGMGTSCTSSFHPNPTLILQLVKWFLQWIRCSIIILCTHVGDESPKVSRMTFRVVAPVVPSTFDPCVLRLSFFIILYWCVWFFFFFSIHDHCIAFSITFERIDSVFSSAIVKNKNKNHLWLLVTSGHMLVQYPLITPTLYCFPEDIDRVFWAARVYSWHLDWQPVICEWAIFVMGYRTKDLQDSTEMFSDC